MTFIKRLFTWFLYTFCYILLFLISLHFFFSIYGLKGDWKQYKDFSATSCQVVDKAVVNFRRKDGVNELGNFPQITVSYNMNNAVQKATAAENLYEPVYEKADAQKVVDSYAIGTSYPCYYEISDPSVVIFSIGMVWPVVVIEFFIIAALLWFTTFLRKKSLS
jgi:hypothetical protein